MSTAEPKKPIEATEEPLSDLWKSIKTGRSLILLQLLSRIVTFILNQSLVRLAPPEVFGTAAIQFDLLSDTVRFLSREGIRNALLRPQTSPSTTKPWTEKPAKGTAQSAAKDAPISHLASVPFFLSFPISAVSLAIYLYLSPPSTLAQRDFHLSLGLYVTSALFELAIEPMYIRTLKSNPPKLNVRVGAEGGMAVGKALLTCLVLVLRPERSLLGFALGQVVGSLCLVTRYVWTYGLAGLAPIAYFSSTPR